ncbi:molybdenum ABC transporter substrate-binding protein [Pseudoclavibacter sp. AY1F1]|uniref:substrate-binding domain-containing protein n=1 Tax=Pseudoclavibacter sp. AY1F1 TaxID=2080583 RepID=UPI000CE87FFF|nr:substrate-binding domain-containing protein [Pseudoclavibacter sp. AY1F1]PPF45452.1 molybdenum ABC transporter substrate-binding protein [Pseudoclavibacter sp. AY1F1]
MITLYSGLVVRQALVDELIPAFEAATGERIVATFEPTTVLLEKIAGGDRPDLFLGVSSSAHELAAQGILDADTVADIAVSAVGFARLAQTPAPSEDTEEAFLQYLRESRVAYTLSGASGIHFMNVLRERNLLDAVDERAVRFPAGLTVEAVIDGRADVAIQQIAELRSVEGEHVVAPIPHALQSYGAFAIGVGVSAPASARAFSATLTEARAQAAFASVGLSAP